MSPAATSVQSPVKPTGDMVLSHGQLTRALKIADLGAAAKSPSEAQRGVLVETGRHRAVLTTFDYETAVSVCVPGRARKGVSLLHLPQFQKALAAMAAGETKAQAERAEVSLTGDLLSTEHLSVPLAVLDLEEFTRPPEPVRAMATVDAKAFFTELARVLPAAGREDTLPLLTSVHLSLAGQTFTLAATDRYRLAEGRVAAEATVQPPATAVNVLFSADVLSAVLKQFKSYDGPIGVGLLSDQSSDVPRATLSLGDTTITVRARDGKFPTYASFFPNEFVASVRMDRATLVKAAKKGRAMTQAVGHKHSPVTLRWDAEGALALAPVVGSPADQDRVKGMNIPFTLAYGAAEDVAGMSVRFNPAYLLDALEAFTGQETVTVHVQEFEEGQSRKPVLLSEDPTGADSYRHLLLPVRLDPPQ
ncbi:hypothetical protein [Streptomyces sp. NPDC059631]|uniref:DNA polymerase III subunit beta family protein n=1 Tax=unclassified Streptomyces TaxID=2593676 RepID=UPI00369F1796